jgi:hypothetical protein
MSDKASDTKATSYTFMELSADQPGEWFTTKAVPEPGAQVVMVFRGLDPETGALQFDLAPLA